MSHELLTSLAIFVLAILVGFEVISKVPATLHTPLMSGANSIHGIVLVGAMIIAAEADNPVSYLLAFVAMVFGAMNVVGGYVVTDRMLQMFRKKPTAAKADRGRRRRPGAWPRSAPMSQEWIYTIVYLAWLVGAACFVLGLHRMNSPATARNGNRLSAAGMVDRRRRDARLPRSTREGGLSGDRAGRSSSSASLIGGGAGLYAARTVKMTAMPQLVSLFNAVGGGAAALVAIDDFIRLNSAAPSPGRHDDLRRPRRGHRLGHVHRLAHRRRQAPGPDPGQADHTCPGGQIVTIAARRRRGRSGPSALILGAAGDADARQRGHPGAPRSSSLAGAHLRRSRWSCRSAAPTCRSSSAC